jgi:hypothetical protein
MISSGSLAGVYDPSVAYFIFGILENEKCKVEDNYFYARHFQRRLDGVCLMTSTLYQIR